MAITNDQRERDQRVSRAFAAITKVQQELGGQVPSPKRLRWHVELLKAATHDLELAAETFDRMSSR